MNQYNRVDKIKTINEITRDFGNIILCSKLDSSNTVAKTSRQRWWAIESSKPVFRFHLSFYNILRALALIKHNQQIKQTLDRMLCAGLDSSNKVAETFVVSMQFYRQMQMNL